MIIFLPERIYNILKSEETYTEIENYAEEKFNTVDSLQELMSFKSILYNDISSKYIVDTLAELIYKLTSSESYEIELRAAFGVYSHKTLFNHFNNPNLDLETRLFCLYRAALSDEHMRYTYMLMYTKTYESIEDNELLQMSPIIHLAYIESKTRSMVNLSETKDTGFVFEVRKALDEFYEKFKERISLDTLNYICIDIYTSIIFDLIKDDKTDNMIVYIATSLAGFRKELFETQYANNSLAKLALLDSRLVLSYYTRDYLAMGQIFELMVKYINEFTNDLKTTLRGLMVYDREYAPQFVVILRRVQKLLNLLELDNLALTNLKNIDLELIESDDLNFTFLNPWNIEEFEKDIKDVDDFIFSQADNLKDTFKFWMDTYHKEKLVETEEQREVLDDPDLISYQIDIINSEGEPSSLTGLSSAISADANYTIGYNTIKEIESEKNNQEESD